MCVCAVYLCVSGCAGRGLEQSRVVTLHWAAGHTQETHTGSHLFLFFFFALFGRAFFLSFFFPSSPLVVLPYHSLCWQTSDRPETRVTLLCNCRKHTTNGADSNPCPAPVFSSFFFFFLPFPFSLLAWRKCKTRRKELEEKDDDSGQGNNFKLNCQERSCETGKTGKNSNGWKLWPKIMCCFFCFF